MSVQIDNKKIVFGETRYLHKADSEYDYLIDNSNDKVKVTLKFTRNREKNETAIKGLKTFFGGIS